MGGQGGKKRKQKSAIVVAEQQTACTTRKALAKESASLAEPPPPAGHDGGDESEGDVENPSSRTMALDGRTDAQIKRSLRSVSNVRTAKTPAGGAVLYLGHIPHGFYEEQMRGFFSQFGTVTRLRLARNRKTGRSKHYAFIEFAHAEVARIVAKAMHGYLMFSKILVCKVVPLEELHPATFKNANKPIKQVDWTKRERERHNKEKSTTEATARAKKLLGRDRRKRQQLEALGIEYDFGGYSEALSKKKAKLAPAVVPVLAPAPAPIAVARNVKAKASSTIGKRKAGSRPVAAVEPAATADHSAVKVRKRSRTALAPASAE